MSHHHTHPHFSDIAKMECVHAYATLGEIINVMKKILGTYEEPNWI